MEATKKNSPVHTVRVGSCKVSIWENETRNGPMLAAKGVRFYATDRGWQESASLAPSDIPLMRKALDRAHDWILEQLEQKARESAEEGRRVEG